MDSVSTQPVASKVKGERRAWSDKEFNALLSLLEEVVAKNMRQDAGQFKNGTLMWVQQQLEAKFPTAGIKVKPHIESIMRRLKNEYGVIYDMLNTSGFGWDDANKKILVDNEDVWAAYIQKDASLKGYRKRTFPYYDRLVVIFGKDRANGKGAKTRADVEENLDREEYANINNTPTQVEEQVNLSDGDIQDINHSTSVNQIQQDAKTINRHVRKRTRVGDSIACSLTEFGKNMIEVLEGTAKRLAAMVENTKCMKDFHDDARAIADELMKMEELTPRQRNKVGCVLMQNPNQVYLFWGFKGEHRIQFVKELIDDM